MQLCKTFSLKMCTIVLVSGLQACATQPRFATEDVSLQSTPAEINQAADNASGTVIWGGVIISSTNLAAATQLEVLAYPLDSRQRPATHHNAQGRFLVHSTGYLETVDYAAGRLITVLGNLDGLTQGSVGDAQYDFPRVLASDMQLWQDKDYQESPKFTFGIGVSLSN